jgi:hypothetical protein
VSILKLQIQYNDTLARMKKAMEFMDGPAPLAEKEKWQPKFKQIEKQLDGLIEEIKATGHEMTEVEIWEGFKEG